MTVTATCHPQPVSRAPTGDYDHDSSTAAKRIFDDPTGSRCAHEKPLLQTYKRDTGEIMHDLSVPIYINASTGAVSVLVPAGKNTATSVAHKNSQRYRLLRQAAA